MMKKLVLTAFVTLIATVIALAQTDPASNAKTTRGDKTNRTEKAKSDKVADKVEHAEERSSGAAFSGKGKGANKGSVAKGEKGKKEKGKGKGKGKHKNKHKSKGKSKRDKAGERDDKDTDTNNQDRRQGTERKRDQERTGGEKAPTTKPTPSGQKDRAPGDKPVPTEQKSRKAGERPAPGTENPKG